MFCLRILFLLALFNSAVASPTLDETVGFIQGKLNSETVFYYQNDDSQPWHKITRVQSFEKVGNCRFRITENSVNMDEINRRTGSVYGSSKREYEFDAKDMNPNSVKVSGIDNDEITLTTTASVDKVITRRTLFDPSKKSTSCVKKKDADITVIDSSRCVVTTKFHSLRVRGVISPRDNLPRLEKAFKHLISICGGKDELF